MSHFKDERYSRLRIIPSIGLKGQEAITRAKIGIFGLGGLGSWSSLLLTQMGVGFLRLVDRDVVELSNLARTPIYDLDSVDLPKAERAAKFLKNLNPDVVIEEMTTNIDDSTIESLIKGLDIIIDGLDNISTRLLINKVCKKYSIPYIFAGAIGTSGNISTFLYESEHDPCLNCIFEMISDDDLEKCDVLGVDTSLLSLVGSIQVSEAIKIITKQKPVFTSKLCYIYMNTLEIDHITLKQNSSCPVCASTTVTKTEKKPKIVELCGDKTFFVPSPNKQPVSIEELGKKIEQSQYKIIKKGSLGLTFEYTTNSNPILVSIFSNGNLLLRGEPDQSKITKIYAEIEKHIIT